MRLRRVVIAVLLVYLGGAGELAAARQWFDAYREGIQAVKRQDWNAVVQKMTEAIDRKPEEEAWARTYGNLFVKYRPYYYRGLAHLSLGNTAAGIADLERTGGPGEVDLGAVDVLLVQARQSLPAPTREPEPPPQRTPEAPAKPPAQERPAQQPPAQPVTPAVDPALVEARRRAEGLLSRANQSLQNARQQQAPSLAAEQYRTGERLLLQASSAQASADTTAAWNRVADLADRAQRTLQASVTAANVASNASRTLPSRTTDEVLASTRAQLRDALESYFGGRFTEAAKALEALTAGEGGKNAMVWAFLGAARYYDYYLDGERDSSQREAAVAAFRRARSIDPSLELSSRYFSPRVQRFYQQVR